MGRYGPGNLHGGLGGQQDLDQELSSIEKFEQEVKYTIYNVLYVLLKDDESVLWKEILQSMIDFLEIYYFSFTTTTIFPWKGGAAYTDLVDVLQFIQINTYYEMLDYTTYIVLFYVVAFIIILLMLDIFYVSYSFQKKKFRFIWPLQVLRSVVSMFVTALFLPVLETFTIVIDCSYSNGYYRHVIDQSIICYQGTHLIHAVISLIISFVFIVICLIVSLTYFEASMQSKSHTAKVNSRSDFFVVVIKIVGTYIFLLIGYPPYQWLLIIILITLSYQAYANFRYNWPYYNDIMNKFFCLTTGIFLWINFCLLISKILEYTDFSGALQLLFLGIPLVVGVIIYGKDERSQLLMKNIINFQTGEEVALQIRYFIQLINSSAKVRRNAIILKGFIHQHEENCTAPECNLRNYKETLTPNSQSKLKNDKGKKAFQQNNQEQYLYLHAQSMYKEGLKRFPNCTALQIQYAFFLMESLGKRKEGLIEFSKAMNFNPSFDEEFIIYRQLKMSEDFGDEQEDEEGGGQEIDIVGKLAYESTLQQFQESIERSANLHYEFWNLLSEDRPDMSKLNYQGSKINNSVAAVESHWSQLQKLNADQPQALMLYSKFLKEILNDKDGGQDLFNRAMNALQNKKNHFEAGNDSETDFNMSNLNGAACIYASGNHQDLGLVNQSNVNAQKMFGYSINELNNHSLNKLMPEIYVKHHDKMLQDGLHKGAENIIKKERFVFGRHKSGFIFPIWLQIKLIETINKGYQFIAMFQIDKKLVNSDIGFILLNKDKKINSLTSSCMNIFDYDYS